MGPEKDPEGGVREGRGFLCVWVFKAWGLTLHSPSLTHIHSHTERDTHTQSCTRTQSYTVSFRASKTLS